MIISVCSEKGGVGKTTTAVNVARALKELGNKVLVIDLDQQGNMGSALGFIPDGSPTTSSELIYNTILGADIDLSVFIRTEDVAGGLDYIPSNQMLTGITNFMANDSDCNYIIKRALSNPLLKEYDYIIFDCRTLLDLLVSNALNASDYVIIPVESKVYSFEGLSSMLNKVSSINKSTNRKLRVLGILLNKMNQTVVSKSVEDSVRETYGDLVFKTTVPDCPAQAENLAMGVGKAGSLRGAFDELAEEIVDRCLKIANEPVLKW